MVFRSAGIASVSFLDEQFAEIVKRAPNRLHVSFTPALSEGDIKSLVSLIISVETGTATSSDVREMIMNFGEFKDTGKRMLIAWNEGVNLLRQSRMYGLGAWKSSEAFDGISDPPKLVNPSIVIGRSELLAQRSKRLNPKRKQK